MTRKWEEMGTEEMGTVTINFNNLCSNFVTFHLCAPKFEIRRKWGHGVGRKWEEMGTVTINFNNLCSNFVTFHLCAPKFEIRRTIGESGVVQKPYHTFRKTIVTVPITPVLCT